MSLAIVERALFSDKDGGDTIIKHRFLGFLIWQSLHSTALLIASKSLLLSFFIQSPLKPSFFSFIASIAFHLSLLFFSTSLFILSSPQPRSAASPFEFLLGCARLVFVPVSSNAQQPVLSPDFRRRAWVSLSFVLFTAVAALSASVAILSLCWSCDVFTQSDQPRSMVVAKLGFRGLVVGFLYGVFYVYKRRWVLQFPIIQRPPFFSFKMGLPIAVVQALKLSAISYSFSAALAFFLPCELKGQFAMGKFIVEQFIFYIGSFVVFFSWELSHHLHQVLHTKRTIFAPPKGSAAAETNPSEPLLATLEESKHRSLLQYLAYLDLCMVCENNVDPWRRAAFFEETGETYKRVIAVCLRPLEQFTLKLAEVLETNPTDNSFQLTQPLRPPAERFSDSKLCELFHDFQLCAWCARIIASLTVRSHNEDRYGVAQLSGSNALVTTTLISGLLAVETFMGKKTNLQSPHYLMDPAGIKWANLGSGRRDLAGGISGKRKGSPLYAKAYSLADILRTSIYCIVSAFHEGMLNGAKAGLLEKNWIASSKPPYGSRELLLQKLQLFLDFRAT